MVGVSPNPPKKVRSRIIEDYPNHPEWLYPDMAESSLYRLTEKTSKSDPSSYLDGSPFWRIAHRPFWRMKNHVILDTDTDTDTVVLHECSNQIVNCVMGIIRMIKCHSAWLKIIKQMCSSRILHPNVFFLIPDLQIEKTNDRF